MRFFGEASGSGEICCSVSYPKCSVTAPLGWPGQDHDRHVGERIGSAGEVVEILTVSRVIYYRDGPPCAIRECFLSPSGFYPVPD